MSEDPRRDYSFDELTRALASGSISRRRALKLFAASVVGSVIPARFAFGQANKVVICHAVPAAADKPTRRYVRIEVSENAVKELERHGGHTKDIIDPEGGVCPKPTTTTTKAPTTTTTTTKAPTTTTTTTKAPSTRP